MNLEYILLIILAIFLYYTSLKDYFKDEKNKVFIRDNLDVGCKIESFGGIIGEVIKIDDISVIIITGDNLNHSYIRIDKEKIKSIISKKA